MITLDGVAKSYGQRVAVHPVTLEFATGTTTVLIGASGCGKSTLLRMIIGLAVPDAGRVLIEGRALGATELERFRHKVGYVIQEGGLFPHLTAERNVALLAEHLGHDRQTIARRVAALAELAGIAPDALGRYPQELSGGQRQRVSLMRALMLDPPLLLLDEPLGALDPITRYELQGELKAIFARLRKTVVMVTHDMAEAAYFADDLIVMREGRVLQRGGYADLVASPAQPYVTTFLRAQRVPGFEDRP